MAYQVLARKYRSQTFDEVVGQEHVAQTLKKAIKSGRVAHAYLFSGTRGVGKTSMARILAKALNCQNSKAATAEPCLKCTSCEAIARGEDMDVIEIDAASNTQVEKTREIIENAQYRPGHSRFKIYIIDEVHMLSKASFNALLKTLEEPPEHVKFILATTEPEKVLPTILSRVQRYDFRNIPTREIAAHLKAVCKGEKIKADEDALILVAKAGAGSMRDSLSLLDRLLSVGEGHLTAETIEQLLGLPHGQKIFDLVQAIGEGKAKEALGAADKMITEGLSADALLASLIDHLRNLLVVRTCGADSNLVEAATLSLDELGKQAQRFEAPTLTQGIAILEDLRRQLRQTQAGRALLDATLVRLALSEQFTSISELLARVNGGGAPSGAGIQKKKPEPMSRPASPAIQAMPVEGEPPMQRVSPVRAPAAPVVENPPLATSAVAEDEEDDLPRPGKVWDGPSLKDVLKQSAQPKPAGSAAAPTAVSPQSVPAERGNVAPVDPSDFKAVWSRLLEAMREHGMAVYSLLMHGQLAGIEDNLALVQYGPEHETFVKMLARNGKREMVGEALSRVMGRPMGVRFELAEQAAVESAAVETTVAPAQPPRRAPAERASQQRPADAIQSAEPPRAPASTRITPEQLLEFEKDPLIGSLLSDLGAIPVKLSEDV